MNVRKLPLVAAVFFALLFAAGLAHAAHTVASPELQKTILGVFPQGPKCGTSRQLKVLSSEQVPGSKVEGGKLVSGEVRELWQATTCDTHTQVRYIFRFSLDKAGVLQVVGFERSR